MSLFVKRYPFMNLRIAEKQRLWSLYSLNDTCHDL